MTTVITMATGTACVVIPCDEGQGRIW